MSDAPREEAVPDRDRRPMRVRRRALPRVMRFVIGRLRGERGQSLIEYGPIVAVIGIAMIIVVTVIGRQTANMYSNISNALAH